MDKETEVLCTVKEAQDMIKKLRGKWRIYVRGEVNLPIVGSGNRIFQIPTLAPVTRNDAIRFVDSTLGTVLEGRGARIRMKTSIRTMAGSSRPFQTLFIG